MSGRKNKRGVKAVAPLPQPDPPLKIQPTPAAIYRVALGYNEAAHILTHAGSEAVVNSATVLRAFAVEILNKSRCAMAGTRPRGHDLESLFNELPLADRQGAIKSFDAIISLKNGNKHSLTLLGILTHCKDFFERFRYIHENLFTADEAELVPMDLGLDVVFEAIESLRPVPKDP